MFYLPEGSTVAFADDTTIMTTSKSIEQANLKSQELFLSANEWFMANRLTLNITKTQKCTFSTKSLENIGNINHVKLLGLHFDQKLLWDHHTETVAKKLSSSTYLIRRLIGRVPIKVVLTSYYALCESHMRYGLLIWGHSPSAIKTIFALQRRVIRIIANIKYRDDCKPHFRKLNIMTLPGLFILECLLYAKKNIQPVTHGDLNKYNTRQADMWYTPFHRLVKTRNGPDYLCYKFMNKLPVEIKTLNVKDFKCKIKKYLLDKAFYSCDDFLTCNFNDCL